MITNSSSGTNVHEVATGIYRINTPMMLPGDVAFSFNQYLIDDDEPLLFHTGLRQLFPLVNEAVASVLPAARLRHIRHLQMADHHKRAHADWVIPTGGTKLATRQAVRKLLGNLRSSLAR